MNTAEHVWAGFDELPMLVELAFNLIFHKSLEPGDFEDFLEDFDGDPDIVRRALDTFRTGHYLGEKDVADGTEFRCRFEDGSVIAYLTDTHDPGVQVWIEVARRDDDPPSAIPAPVPAATAPDPRYYISMSSTESFVRDGYRDTGRSKPTTAVQQYEFWVRRGPTTLLDRYCCPNTDNPELRNVFAVILGDAGLDPSLALRLWQDLKLSDKNTEVSFTLKSTPRLGQQTSLAQPDRCYMQSTCPPPTFEAQLEE